MMNAKPGPQLAEDVLTRRLHPNDAFEATRLISNSFDPRLLALTIFGQKGAQLRLRDVALSAVASREGWVVVDRSAAVVAYAEFDVAALPAAHLSYIAVHAEARGNRLAARLISAFASAHPELHTMTLDVFDNNSAALALYSRLGFEAEGASRWWLREIPRFAGTGSQVEILDRSLSSEAHSQYGFSMVKLMYQDRSVGIGRLGSNLIRATSMDQFNDIALLAAIRGEFPMSRTALLVAEESLTPAGGHGVARTMRMRASNAGIETWS